MVFRLLDAVQGVSDFQVLPAIGAITQNTVVFEAHVSALFEKAKCLGDLRCEIPIRVHEETKSVRQDGFAKLLEVTNATLYESRPQKQMNLSLSLS